MKRYILIFLFFCSLTMTVTGKSKTKIRAFTDQGTEEDISQIINGEYNSIPLNDMKNWSKWARDQGCMNGKLLSENNTPVYEILYTGDQDFSVNFTQPVKVNPESKNQYYLLACKVFLAYGKLNSSFVLQDENKQVINWIYSPTYAVPQDGYQVIYSLITVPEGVRYIEPRFVGEGKTYSKVKEVRFDEVKTLNFTDALELENDILKVTCNAEKASFNVFDKRISKNYKQAEDMLSGMFITGGKVIDNSIILEGFSASGKCKVNIRAELNEDELSYSLNLKKSDNKPVNLPDVVYFPQRMISSEDDYFVIPMNEGIRFDWNEKDIYTGELPAYSGHGICMPFYGIANQKDGSGFISIIETPDDASIKLQEGDYNSVKTIWHSQKGYFGYERKLTQKFLTSGNHVGIAKVYREYAKKKGLVVTFDEKKQERGEKSAENIEKLFGAVNIWCWYWEWNNHTPYNFVKEIHDSGFDKVLWSNKQSAAQVEKINGLGFLTGRYDMYQDVMDPKNYKELQYVSSDWCEEAFPQDINLNKDGSLTNAWPVEDKNGNFINCVSMCDLKSPFYARKRISEELSKIPFNTRFFDTTTASSLRECYSSEHPMTRTESKNARYELLGVASKEYGLITGSETGMDFVVPVCDYFEGMMSLGPYRTEDAGRNMDVIHWEVPPQINNYQLNEKNRLPLWELVYHDCCVAYWYWGDYNNRFPLVWDKRDKFNKLYAVPPMFWILNEDHWKENKDRFIQSYSYSHEAILSTAGVEMTNHEYLSADRSIQKTTFSNGVEITVDFRK